MNWKKIASQMLVAAAVTVAAATASHAQVFNYSTVFSPTPINVGGAGGFQINIQNGAAVSNLATPTTTINLANLKLSDIGAPGPNGTFFFNQNFTIDLTITPTLPAAAGITKTVTGNLSGSVSYLGGASGTLNSVVFTLPTVTPYNPLVYDFGLAGQYIVDNPSYTSFGPLSSTTDGAIKVDVSYVPGVPEPGEYAVMGLAGLTLCGLMVRARRRRTVGGMAA